MQAAMPLFLASSRIIWDLFVAILCHKCHGHPNISTSSTTWTIGLPHSAALPTWTVHFYQVLKPRKDTSSLRGLGTDLQLLQQIHLLSGLQVEGPLHHLALLGVSILDHRRELKSTQICCSGWSGAFLFCMVRNMNKCLNKMNKMNGAKQLGCKVGAAECTSTRLGRQQRVVTSLGTWKWFWCGWRKKGVTLW